MGVKKVSSKRAATLVKKGKAVYTTPAFSTKNGVPTDEETQITKVKKRKAKRANMYTHRWMPTEYMGKTKTIK